MGQTRKSVRLILMEKVESENGDALINRKKAVIIYMTEETA